MQEELQKMSKHMEAEQYTFEWYHSKEIKGEIKNP
jgi:hypothetical protein